MFFRRRKNMPKTKPRSRRQPTIRQRSVSEFKVEVMNIENLVRQLMNRNRELEIALSEEQRHNLELSKQKDWNQTYSPEEVLFLLGRSECLNHHSSLHETLYVDSGTFFKMVESNHCSYNSQGDVELCRNCNLNFIRIRNFQGQLDTLIRNWT